MDNEQPTIIERLRDEADQCRNDGADDIAALLDDAAAEIEAGAAALDVAANEVRKMRSESVRIDERAAFEAWVPLRGGSHLMRSGISGQYTDNRVAAKWAAWAARSKLASYPPIDMSLRLAADRTREDLGPAGSNYPDVRTLLAFAEQAIAAKA